MFCPSGLLCFVYRECDVLSMRIRMFFLSGLCCVVSLTCDDLSNLILMFLCMRIVMGFSCVDWDVVSVQVVIFDRSRTF
jgi:hypothetical protein